MDARISAAISGAIVLVVTLIICSQPLIPIQKTVTHYIAKPYSFEQQAIREIQVRPFPWFWEETQSQYMVKNDDYNDGIFTVNYQFDNGSELRTRTKRVKVLAGEQVTLTINSPLPGKSRVSVYIVPPSRMVAQQEVVTENVSTWYFLNPLLWLFGR